MFFCCSNFRVELFYETLELNVTQLYIYKLNAKLSLFISFLLQILTKVIQIYAEKLSAWIIILNQLWCLRCWKFRLNDDNLWKITACINYVNSPNINPLWKAIETVNYSCKPNRNLSRVYSRRNSILFAGRFTLWLMKKNNPMEILVYSCSMKKLVEEKLFLGCRWKKRFPSFSTENCPLFTSRFLPCWNLYGRFIDYTS